MADVMVAVSGHGPEAAARRLSALTPVVEDDERDELVLQHPAFRHIEEDEVFLTETKTAEAETSTQKGADNQTDVDDVDCGESRDENGLNSDSEHYDEVYSDSNSESSDCESKEEDYETDLEFDEERWLYPERFDLDLTGKAKYIKTCEDMGISPTTYFIKHIQDRELKMKFHGLGPLRMKALSVPLQTNTNIEVLNLAGNAIDEPGAVCLTKVLRENFFITELVLAENKLGTEGGRAICEMLINNRNLYKVDLTANEIGDGAVPMICEVLYNNKLLKVLLLGNNQFEDEGARQLKAAISDNTTLEVLDLSWNNFKCKGANFLAEAVQENIGLKSFNMAMAGLGQDGAEALARALRENRTLLELDASLNRINVEGAISVARGVKENDTIKVLKLGSNPFDSKGAMVILEAVDMNDSSELQLLDFSNIMVKAGFARLAARLTEERGIRIVSEGVIPEVGRTNSARHNAFRSDPVGVFKAAAETASLDLGELMVPFMDEEYTVDIREFKTAINGAGLGLTVDQVNLVALRLSTDGRVQCSFDVTVPGQDVADMLW
ncbi:LR74A-like protein [Mya arenaria]|uniref:LR74A-like protein n=1 Tax=Mya arenaria TaxID=6604 RepID=A0ABY7F9I6_MYAAR|nr:LR74A-like protein [Mya arenaria]